MPDISVLFWFFLLVALVVAEALSTALVSIWFAAGALAALLLSTLKFSVWVQISVFFIVSAILLLATRPLVKRFLEPKITKTNFDRIIGEECIVEEEINNLAETGAVKVKGTEWTARSEHGDTISVGSTVEINRIEGVKVFVTKK